MAKGDKDIPALTLGQVQELAEEAREQFIQETQIESYIDMEPIFKAFDDAGKQPRHCFAYLVKKGVLKPEQEKSFQNAFSRFRKRRKTQNHEAEAGNRN